MGSVMSPRVVLGARPSSVATVRRVEGVEIVEEQITIPNLPASIGGQPVWSEVVKVSTGSRDAFEFRHPELGRLVTIQDVGPSSSGLHVFVAWVPALEREGSNPIFDALAPALIASGVLVAFWPCVEVDGAILPELDASPEADLVRAAWPSSWRVRLAGDSLGDPLGSPLVAPSPPTGPIMLGEIIA